MIRSPQFSLANTPIGRKMLLTSILSFCLSGPLVGCGQIFDNGSTSETAISIEGTNVLNALSYVSGGGAVASSKDIVGAADINNSERAVTSNTILAAADSIFLANSTPSLAEKSAPTRNTTGSVENPIVFVAQVPTAKAFGSRMATFANHLTNPDQVPRGGDLYIRYPNGALRNLTKEAGFGMEGQQADRAIAVREPSVHWDGKKVIFSMVVGAPARQHEAKDYFWQLYEVSGLGVGEKAVITKVPFQPPNYNNVSPIYGTDDKILFTSDRPRNGAAHLYPQLDEYESSATITGIWALDVAAGKFRLLNHTVSGAFNPFIDSTGRLIFTRWDHLLQDQQADIDRASASPIYGAMNFSDEGADAMKLPLAADYFPEPRKQSFTKYGRVNPFETNLFMPWQMNEDGTDEVTLNHFGRHEYQFNAIVPSFMDDAALASTMEGIQSKNRMTIRSSNGLFQLAENKRSPGNFVGVYSREFGTLTSGPLVQITGASTLTPESMTITPIVQIDARTNESVSGRYRNPVYLQNGRLISSFTKTNEISDPMLTEFRLTTLIPAENGTSQMAGAPLLQNGIRKSLSWWSPAVLAKFDGLLWEIEPVEVTPRVRPSKAKEPMPTPEKSIFQAEGVDESAFRNWLVTNNLSLIVTRNQTSRELSDKLQPFNLSVPNGVETIASPLQRKYEISHYQLLQADQVRGYKQAGRRPIAQPSADVKRFNPSNPEGPASSVKISPDGSTAAFVPANRAMTWQTTDASGEPIVRDRVWVTFQPGEVRVCASCHGLNTKDQIGRKEPINPPEALRTLLRSWKAMAK
jgi:Hydrazine synthase alpha subunit middle domain